MDNALNTILILVTVTMLAMVLGRQINIDHQKIIDKIECKEGTE